MIKCPRCNNAQFKPIITNFEIDPNYDNIVYVQRVYRCSCGKVFTTESEYFSENEEKIDRNTAVTEDQLKNMGV